jgi:hypothetical protein
MTSACHKRDSWESSGWHSDFITCRRAEACALRRIPTDESLMFAFTSVVYSIVKVY